MNADRLILKALSLAKKGKKAHASQLLREVLVMFPGNIRAKEGLCRILTYSKTTTKKCGSIYQSIRSTCRNKYSSSNNG